METLAQRMVKRAKTAMGDEPPASTIGAPELIIISPKLYPQCSPQRKSTTHFLLASAGTFIFATDIAGPAGEERQQG
jgi:hypothetical protein